MEAVSYGNGAEAALFPMAFTKLLCTSFVYSCATSFLVLWQVQVYLRLFLFLFLSVSIDISGYWLLHYELWDTLGNSLSYFPSNRKVPSWSASLLYPSKLYICIIYNVQGF